MYANPIPPSWMNITISRWERMNGRMNGTPKPTNWRKWQKAEVNERIRIEDWIRQNRK